MAPQSDKYIDAVMAAYQDWFGAPSDTMRLARAPGSAGPAEMGIVIYLPEASPEGSKVTLLGTAGMSAQEMKGPVPLAELGIEIKATLAADVLKSSARRVADIASVPFQTGKGYKLNSVLQGVDIPPFDGFNAIYLLEWDPYDKLRPKGFDKAFPLLRLVPVFEQEAQFIEKSNDRNRAYLSLKRKGLDPSDYKRKPVVE